MPISLITQNLKGKNRCIISHPVNPPHLIPCVEISPSSKTSEEVIHKTKDIFEKTKSLDINSQVTESLEKALQIVYNEKTYIPKIILITGSLYLVGSFLEKNK